MRTSAILSAALLVTSVWALPSRKERLATRAARRASRQSQPHEPYAGSALLAANATKHEALSYNWAGAVSSWPLNHVWGVSASFVVPTPSIPANGDPNSTYWAAAWVGVDGSTCNNAILQTGVDFGVNGAGVGYDAWYEFFPDYASYFDGIDFHPGDTIQLSAKVTTDYTTSMSTGTVIVHNNSTGHTVSKDLESYYTMCQSDAEWIVEDFTSDGSYVPFADFGTITFTDILATTHNGTKINTAGATIIDIVDHQLNVLTKSEIAGDTVTVSYIAK